MGESDFRLFLIGVIEREFESVGMVPEVILRSLDLFYIIAVFDGKIRFEGSASVCSCRDLLNERILFDDDLTVCGLDVSPGIDPEDASGEGILCGIVLFHNGYFCLLTVIFDRHVPEHHFSGQGSKGQGDVLTRIVQDEVLRCAGLLYGIGPEIKVVEDNAAVITGRKAVFYEVALFKDRPAACRLDLLPGIDRESGSLLFTGLIFEGGPLIRYFRTGEHLAFFVDGDLPTNLLIGERMGESYGCLFIVGVGSRKVVDITAVQLIAGRSREFFDIELIPDRKVGRELSLSVRTGRYFPDQGIFLDNDRSCGVFNVRVGIESVDGALDDGLSELVLFYSRDLHLLTVVAECRCTGHISTGAACREGNSLAFPFIYIICGGAGLCDHICSHVQVGEGSFTIAPGLDRADRSSLLVDDGPVRGSDVRTCCHTVGCSGEFVCFVFEYGSAAVRCGSGQDLALLGDLDGSHDLIILEALCHGRTGRKIDCSDFCGKFKTFGWSQLFQIHGSGSIELHSGSTVCICGGHLYQQACACLVGIDSIDRSGKLFRTSGIGLGNGELRALDPGHGQLHIFGFGIDCFSENKCEILFLVRTSRDHVGGVVLGDTAVEF